MLLSKLENMNTLHDFTYYKITIFKDKNKYGESYPIAYKYKKNAEKTIQKLINSGLYECIVLRREEVTEKSYNCYYSVSSPIWKYEV